MPRPKMAEMMRHEKEEEEVYVNFHDVEEEPSFVPKESVVVSAPPTAKRGKGKRTIEDMMSSMPNDAAKSVYAMERIAAFEDQIAKVLALCTKDAREIVLKQRPSLKKYAPEE